MTIDSEFFEKRALTGTPQFPTLETSMTQLNEWSRCDRKYFYRYVRGLVPIGTNFNLQWGTLWHRVAQEYYRSLQNHTREDAALHNAQMIAERCKVVENKVHGDTKIDFEDSQRETLWDTFEYYYNQVARMDDWDEIISVEEQLYCVIGYQGQPVMRIRNTIDLLARKDGKLIPVDHKTTGDIDQDLSFLALDLQVPTYSLAVLAYYQEDPLFCYNMIAREVPPGVGHRPLTTPTGRTRNAETAARMANPQNYLRREWIPFTEEKAKALQRELVQITLAIQFDGTSGIWPRRVVKTGGMSCTNCSYFSICGAEKIKMIEDDAPLLTMAFTKDPNMDEMPKPGSRLIGLPGNPLR